MRYILSITLSLTVLILFISCSKEKTHPKGAIEGNWKFMGMYSDMRYLRIFYDIAPGSLDFYSNYTGADYSGSVSVSDQSITLRDLGCNIKDTLIEYEYEGSTLTHIYEEPLVYNATPTSASANFQYVGTDSIAFLANDPFEPTTHSYYNASGARFKVNGNTLSLFFNVAKEDLRVSAGLSTYFYNKDVVTLVFQRQ